MLTLVDQKKILGTVIILALTSMLAISARSANYGTSNIQNDPDFIINKFAEVLHPLLFDLENFSDSKMENFFAKLSLLKRGSRAYDGPDFILNFSQVIKELIAKSDLSSQEAAELKHIYNQVIDGNAVSEPVLKALLINAIKMTKPHEYESLQDHSLIDLAEILNELHHRETPQWQKIQLAITGAPWPELTPRAYLTPLLLTIVIYTAAMLCMLKVAIHNNNFALAYAVPLLPAFISFILYSSYNYAAYRQAAHYKPVGCQLF